jgi:O-antigen/teichoic acid export membrane protein
VPGRAWEKSAIAELLGFGSNVVGISLLGFLNRRAGELIIGVTLGAVPLGLYSVAMRILNLCLDVLVINVQKVALPVFSRVADDPRRLSRANHWATEATTFTAFPGFTLLALFGGDLAPLVFGAQWDRVGPLMSVLALMGPAQSIALFSNSMMLATGRARMALQWTAATAVLNVTGFAVGSLFGVVTVAALYVSLSWVLLLVGLYLVRHVSTVTLRDQLLTMGVPLVGCLAMAGLVVLLRALTDFSPIVDLLVGAPLALVLYAVVVVPARRELVRGLLERLRSKRRPQPVVTEG